MATLYSGATLHNQIAYQAPSSIEITPGIFIVGGKYVASTYMRYAVIGLDSDLQTTNVLSITSHTDITSISGDDIRMERVSDTSFLMFYNYRDSVEALNYYRIGLLEYDPITHAIVEVGFARFRSYKSFPACTGLRMMTATKGMVVYEDDSREYSFARGFNISGDTVTIGNQAGIYGVYGDWAQKPTIEVIDSDNVLSLYQDGRSGTTEVRAISSVLNMGDDLVITMGTQLKFFDKDTYSENDPGLLKLENGTFVANIGDGCYNLSANVSTKQVTLNYKYTGNIPPIDDGSLKAKNRGFYEYSTNKLVFSRVVNSQTIFSTYELSGSTMTLIENITINDYVSYNVVARNSLTAYLVTGRVGSENGPRVYAIGFNQAPTAPTITYPTGGERTDSLTPTATWDFNDPDAGDTQSEYLITMYQDGSPIGNTDWIVSSVSEFVIYALPKDTLFAFTVTTKDSSGAISPESAQSEFILGAFAGSYVNIDNDIKKNSKRYVNINGVLKRIVKRYVNVDGLLYRIM